MLGVISLQRHHRHLFISSRICQLGMKLFSIAALDAMGISCVFNYHVWNFLSASCYSYRPKAPQYPTRRGFCERVTYKFECGFLVSSLALCFELKLCERLRQRAPPSSMYNLCLFPKTVIFDLKCMYVIFNGLGSSCQTDPHVNGWMFCFPGTQR